VAVWRLAMAGQLGVYPGWTLSNINIFLQKVREVQNLEIF